MFQRHKGRYSQWGVGMEFRKAGEDANLIALGLVRAKPKAARSRVNSSISVWRLSSSAREQNHGASSLRGRSVSVGWRRKPRRAPTAVLNRSGELRSFSARPIYLTRLRRRWIRTNRQIRKAIPAIIRMRLVVSIGLLITHRNSGRNVISSQP